MTAFMACRRVPTAIRIGGTSKKIWRRTDNPQPREDQALEPPTDTRSEPIEVHIVITFGRLLHGPGDPASQIDFERRGHTAEGQEIKERVDEHGQAPHGNSNGHVAEEG